MKKLKILFLCIITFMSGFIARNYLENQALINDIQNRIDFCFTPPSGCGKLIAREIAKAKNSIYMQAYGLTAKIITDQIILAKNRGVDVHVLLDKSNISSKHSRMQELIKNGIDVKIDTISGIAHNKVIIIDNKQVITGSFNFTYSADNRNAENVVFIHNEEAAKKYFKNWESRYNKNK